MDRRAPTAAAILGGTRPTEDGGTPPGRVAVFVARSKPLLRGLGVAAAFLVLLAWSHPSALTVLAVGLLLVVYVAILDRFYRFDDESAAKWYGQYAQRSHDDPDGLAQLFGARPVAERKVEP